MRRAGWPAPDAASAADLKFLQRFPQIRVGTSNRKAALETHTCQCPFASEVRVRGCRHVSRTSEAGHEMRLDPCPAILAAMKSGRRFMKLMHAAVALAFLWPAGAAVAEPAKSLKDQLVGTWTFVVAEV